MKNAGPSTDINLISVLRDIFAARLFLTVGLCVGLMAAFAFIVIANPQTQARMLVGPAQLLDAQVNARYQDGQNSYMRMPENESTAKNSVSNFIRFEAIMRGISVARLLLRDQRIAEGLFNDRQFVFSQARSEMQPADLARYIEKRVNIDPFGETSLKALTYRHGDPVFAAYLLQQIHRVSDQLIRADLRNHVDQRIAYLERVIAKTSNPEQRRIMTNLLLEQERIRMMVSMEAPVAASVIEPAAAGSRAVWPDPYLFYAGFGFLGLLIGYLVFGVVSYEGDIDYARDDKPVFRGDELQHKPKRPLKYGSWFQNEPDNSNDVRPKKAQSLKGAGDAAE